MVRPLFPGERAPSAWQVQLTGSGSQTRPRVPCLVRSWWHRGEALRQTPLMASPLPQEAPVVTPVQELQQGHKCARQSLRRRHCLFHRHQIREGQHAISAGGAPETAQSRGGCHSSQAGQDPRESVVGPAGSAPPLEAETQVFL